MALNLPTMAEVQAQHFRKPQPKGKLVPPKKAKRLRDRVGRLAEKAWRDVIWARDLSQCQCCHNPVLRTEDLVPNRGECHHIKSRRVKAVRNDPRNGILVCRECHGKLTDNKLRITQPRALYFKADDDVLYINSYRDLRFREVA